MNTFVVLVALVMLTLLFVCIKNYPVLKSYYSIIESSIAEVEGEAYATIFPKRNVIPFWIHVNVRQFRQFTWQFFTWQFFDFFQQGAEKLKIKSLDGTDHSCNLGDNEILVVFMRTNAVPKKFTAHGSLSAMITDSLAGTRLRTFSVFINPKKPTITGWTAIVYCEDFNHEGEGGILHIYAGRNVYLDFEQIYSIPPKNTQHGLRSVSRP